MKRINYHFSQDLSECSRFVCKIHNSTEHLLMRALRSSLHKKIVSSKNLIFRWHFHRKTPRRIQLSREDRTWIALSHPAGGASSTKKWKNVKDEIRGTNIHVVWYSTTLFSGIFKILGDGNKEVRIWNFSQRIEYLICTDLETLKQKSLKQKLKKQSKSETL